MAMMTTPWMCVCGHVRGAHGGDAESCRVCSCPGFHSPHMEEKLQHLVDRLNELEAKLAGLGARLDSLRGER